MFVTLFLFVLSTKATATSFGDELVKSYLGYLTISDLETTVKHAARYRRPFTDIDVSTTPDGLWREIKRVWRKKYPDVWIFRLQLHNWRICWATAFCLNNTTQRFLRKQDETPQSFKQYYLKFRRQFFPQEIATNDLDR